MAETISLTIQVNDDGSQKVQNFAKNVQAAGGSIEDTGKQTEAGRLGFFALGNVVEDAARSMGVTGQASRQLGNSVERVAASSLPMWGVALGVATLAGGAVVSMLAQYAENQARQREETIKAGAAAEQWIQTAFKDEQQTDALTAAIRKQTEARRADALFNLGEKQALDKDTLIEKQRTLNTVLDEYNQLRSGKGDDMSTGYDAIAEARLQQKRNKLQREIDVLKSDIGVQENRLLQGKGDIPPPKTGYGPEQRLSSDVAYTTAVKSLWEQQGVGYQDLQTKELEIFNQTTAAKLNGMTNQTQKQDYLATRSVELEVMLAKQKTELRKKDLEEQAQADETRLKMLEQTAAQTQSINQSFSSFNSNLPGIFDALTSTLGEQNETSLKAFDSATEKQGASFQTLDEKDKYAKDRMMQRDKLLAQQQQKNTLHTIGSYQSMASFGIDMYSSLAKSGDKSAKEQFETQKKAAYATTVVNTATGMMKAYASAPNPYVGAALAALVLLAGAAQLSNISSSSYDGGGSISSGGDASSTTSSNETAQPQYSHGGPVTNVYVTGDILDMDNFSRKIYPSIKKAERDNVH